MRLRTTREAAAELGLQYSQVFNLIRYGRIDPPAKTGAGDYCWSDADLSAARRALASRRERQEVVA